MATAHFIQQDIFIQRFDFGRLIALFITLLNPRQLPSWIDPPCVFFFLYRNYFNLCLNIYVYLTLPCSVVVLAVCKINRWTAELNCVMQLQFKQDYWVHFNSSILYLFYEATQKCTVSETPCLRCHMDVISHWWDYWDYFCKTLKHINLHNFVIVS